MDALARLEANPFDLRSWQDAYFDTAKKNRFLLVRASANAAWTRIINIDLGNCSVQFTSDGKRVNSFVPADATIAPFQLGIKGEVKASISLDGFSCHPPHFLPSKLARQPNVGNDYSFGLG